MRGILAHYDQEWLPTIFFYTCDITFNFTRAINNYPQPADGAQEGDGCGHRLETMTGGRIKWSSGRT